MSSLSRINKLVAVIGTTALLAAGGLASASAYNPGTHTVTTRTCTTVWPGCPALALNLTATYTSDGSQITYWGTTHASVTYIDPLQYVTNVGSDWQAKTTAWGLAHGWASIGIGIPTPWGGWGIPFADWSASLEVAA
jgi:hypothetical protein